MPTLKQKVVKGAIWTLLEKFSTQIVSFIVGMILARLLTTVDYACPWGLTPWKLRLDD